jgi:hypothetical protein
MSDEKQQLLEKIEKLQQENARLKAAWDMVLKTHQKLSWFSFHAQGKQILDGIHNAFDTIDDLVTYPKEEKKSWF